MGQGEVGAASQELEHLAGAWFQAVGGKSVAAFGFSLKIQRQAQPPLRKAESEQATLAPGTGLQRAERCDGRRAPSAPPPPGLWGW